MDADGVLIVTPEYNYGTTGVLKNAIDWANRGPQGRRGPRHSPMALKPVYIMGAASTFAGSARAQTAVREAMIEPGALVYTYPQVLVARAQDKLDDDGAIADQLTLDYVALAMRTFDGWIRLVGERSGSPHRDALAELHVIDPRRQALPGV
jgi:chromate reductase